MHSGLSKKLIHGLTLYSRLYKDDLRPFPYSNEPKENVCVGHVRKRKLNGGTDGQTDGWMNATKSIISLLHQSFVVNNQSNTVFQNSWLPLFSVIPCPYKMPREQNHIHIQDLGIVEFTKISDFSPDYPNFLHSK